MSNIVSEVIKIKYNFFTLAPAMLSFYESCQVKQNNVLLMYLLFPIILNSDWIGERPRIRKDSRLEKWVKNNRIHVEGLPERITTFEHLTETTMQYCIDMGYAYIDENNVIVVKKPSQNRLFVATAEKLAKLMGESSPAKIYATLGIRELEI